MLDKTDIESIVSQFGGQLRVSRKDSWKEVGALMSFVEKGYQEASTLKCSSKAKKRSVNTLIYKGMKKPKDSFELSTPITEDVDKRTLYFLMCSVAWEFLCEVYNDHGDGIEGLDSLWLITQSHGLKELWIGIQQLIWETKIQPEFNELEAELRKATSKLKKVTPILLSAALISLVVGLCALFFTNTVGGWIFAVIYLILCIGCSYIVGGISLAEERESDLKFQLNLKIFTPSNERRIAFNDDEIKLYQKELNDFGIADEICDFMTSGLRQRMKKIDEITASLQVDTDQLNELDSRLFFMKSKQAFLIHLDRSRTGACVGGMLCMLLSIPLAFGGAALLYDPYKLGLDEEGNYRWWSMPILISSAFLPFVLGPILPFCEQAHAASKRRESIDDFIKILSWVKEEQNNLPGSSSYGSIQDEFFISPPERALEGLWSNGGCCTACENGRTEQRIHKSIKSLIEYYTQKRSSLLSDIESFQESEHHHTNYEKREESGPEMSSVSSN